MGHPRAEFIEVLESKIASVTASKKTDGFPVHVFSGNKTVWLRLNFVMLDKERDAPCQWAKNH